MKSDAGIRKALEDLGPSYRFVREIGQGATAVVYLLRDTELGRDIAVKVIRSSFIHDQEAIQRLRREARLVAQLHHPNIVKLFGTTRLGDGSLAVLMDHVPGRNLKEILREEGAFDPIQVVSILIDVADALAYAHRRRIVHRDVKPENIYLDEEVGSASLADFGVARPWDRDSRLTVPGTALGTPAYMSPEQIDDLEIDGRSDIYSLGVVGYELLAGHHPWEEENLFSIIFKQKNEELPPLKGPGELVATLAKAYRKNPDERWPSAEALLEQLRALRVALAGDPIAAARLPRLEPDVTSPEEAAGAQDVPAAAPGPGRGAADGEVSGGPGAAPRGSGSPVVDAPPTHRPGQPLPAPADQIPRGGPGVARAPRKRKRRRVGRTALLLFLVGAVGGAYAWWSTGAEVPGWLPLPSSLLTRVAPATTPAAPGGGPTGPSGVAAVAPDDLSLEVVSGEGQRAMVGTAAAEPLGVRVTDPEGVVVAGADVRFVLPAEGGELRPEVASTDDEGIARTNLVLPDEPATVVVIAGIDGTDVVGARWEVLAVSELSNVTARGGDGQVAAPGQPTPDPISVRVTDQDGTPTAGAEVRFEIATGGGSVTPSNVRTDGEGWAVAVWWLGPAEGEQRLTASVPLADTVVEFRADAVAEGAAPRPPTAQAEEPRATEPTVAPPDPTDPDPADPSVTDPGAADTAELPTPPGGADPGLLPVRVVPRAFAVGGSTLCRLNGGGRVQCRGGDAGVQAVAAIHVATGVAHACVLDDSGAAACWGGNESGQLGDGSTVDRVEATAVISESPFVEIAAGLSHTCALDPAGSPHCWGRNLSGQLGDGSRADRSVPGPAAGEISLRRMVAGWNHTCGLDLGNRAVCWGLNTDGQLGDGSRLDRLTPTRVRSAPRFTLLAAGSSHTCGLSDGEVFCWGGNRSGQLGDGSATDRTVPVLVDGLPADARQIVAGAVHACALIEDGSAWCWGQNLHGQLGDGSTADRPSPVEVAGDLAFDRLYAGGGVTCGVSTDGDEYCWGLNQNGQLGDGTRTNRSTPTRVRR